MEGSSKTLETQILEFSLSYYLNKKLAADRELIVTNLEEILKSINPQLVLIKFGSFGSELVTSFVFIKFII